MSICIAICDDDQVQRDHLRLMVGQWAELSGHAANIKLFSSGDAFLFHWVEEKDSQILLLDIQMPGANGMEVARAVRAGRDDAQIVFITGFADFMSEGYDVSALHYLMKPVSRQKLFDVLTKAAERLFAPVRQVVLSVAGGSVRLSVSDILFCESFSHSVTLHTADGPKEFAVRMSDMEKLLGEGFFRCHRSYIVNMQHVRKVTRAALHLEGGREIPLARGLYDAANQAFIISATQL